MTAPPSSGRTVVIVNPSAGGGRTGKIWSKLAARLREAYGAFDDCLTTGPGDGARLAREALRAGADTVIAVGGDGSIHDVVNGFFADADPNADAASIRALRPEAALGVISLGTGGDFIRSIGIPRDPLAAARALAAAPPRPIDVGRLCYTDHTGQLAARYFINVASFGIAGLVDKYVNQSKKSLPGTLAFALATLRAGLAYSNAPVRVRVDDGEWQGGPIYNVALANARCFGGGMKIAPQACLDDGQLDLIHIGAMGMGQLLLHGLDLYSGKHLEHAWVRSARVRRVEAEPLDDAEVLLDVDGEQPGRLPARFEILPAAIRLRAPELPT